MASINDSAASSTYTTKTLENHMNRPTNATLPHLPSLGNPVFCCRLGLPSTLIRPATIPDRLVIPFEAFVRLTRQQSVMYYASEATQHAVETASVIFRVDVLLKPEHGPGSRRFFTQGLETEEFWELKIEHEDLRKTFVRYLDHSFDITCNIDDHAHVNTQYTVTVFGKKGEPLMMNGSRGWKKNFEKGASKETIAAAEEDMARLKAALTTIWGKEFLKGLVKY